MIKVYKSSPRRTIKQIEKTFKKDESSIDEVGNEYQNYVSSFGLVLFNASMPNILLSYELHGVKCLKVKL
ncbi:MAG: hypothetical protein H6622_05155 [Halobacteriovoraceae bacterium]|nr:hypothetical protein [Halobacteriovoraceae bacterium]